MPPTVLIIDDNQDEILITKMVISETGRDINTETATSGEAGLALLQDSKPLPGLILLDLKMRGMDGIEVLHRIRAEEQLKNLPVVVVTNSSLETDRKEAMAAGANEFLHKAFDIDTFGRDIRKILDHWLAN